MNSFPRKFPNGIEMMGIPPYDPLHVPALDIIQPGTSAVSLAVHLMQLQILGLYNATVESVRGFVENMNGKVVTLKVWISKVTILSKFKMDGHFLIIPIHESGGMNVTFDRVRTEVKLRAKVINEFLHVEKAKMSFNPQRYSDNYQKRSFIQFFL